MISAILVATDASPASNKAIDMAADMAAKYDASLALLYVIREMQLPDELRNMAEVEKIAGPRAEVLQFVAGKILHDAETRAKDHGAARVESITREGDPASCIIEEAKGRSVDLVVMGTRGLGQVKGMLLGSVSRKVSNLADVNCLIVRG